MGIDPEAGHRSMASQQPEEAPRESEQWFRALSAHAPVGIFLTDARGHCVFVNERWCTIAGMSPAEAAGEGWNRAVHPEDRERVFHDWYTAAQAGREFSSEYRFQTPARKVTWLRGRAVSLRNPAGEVTGYVGTVTDITEAKQVEGLLRRQAELLEQTSDAIFVWELGGAILFWNRAAERLYGYTRAEVLGRRSHDLLSTVHPLGMARTEEILAREGEWAAELTHTTRDGRQIVVESRQVLVQEAEGHRLVLETNRDITARKRAEQALFAERERLRITLSSIGDAVIVTDAEGRPTFLNPAAETLTGWPLAEATGRSLDEVFRIVNEQTRRTVESPVRRVLREGIVVGLANHTLLIARDGTERAIDDSAAPIPDEAGRAAGVVLVFRDVTERRRAEEVHSRLAAIVESSDLAIISKDLEGVVTSWNRAAERLYGYSPAEIVGQPITRIIPPDYMYEFPALMERLRRGERIEQYETERVRKDGQRLDVMVNISPMRSHSGAITGASVIARDITEARRAAQERLESEQRLRLALQAGRMGTWEWEIRTGRIAWSADLEAIHGLAPGSFSGTFEAYLQDVHPDDREHVATALRRALEEGVDHHIEYRLLWADGSTRWVEGRGRLFRDDSGEPRRMIGVCMDITERKQAEEALQEAARRKDDFLAMLAHELRNPLAPVRNALHLLRLQGGDSRAVERLQAMMDRQVQHMTRLIDDLLDVSRITRGKIRLQRERLDLVPLIRVTLEDHQAAFHAGGLTLEAALPETPVWVLGDVTRLTQVLDNLLENARKFTERGGTVRVELGVESHESKVESSVEGKPAAVDLSTLNPQLSTQWAVLTVTDTGVGIEPELLPQLFDVFAQADHSLDRSGGGLGLGLALVKGLVELHEGRVEVRSEGIGQGAQFILRLPREPEPPALTADPLSVTPRTQGLRVLIIEDHPDAAESMRMLLEAYGCEVRVANTGPAGLEAVRESRPDVVLCDIGLPGMDGYAVARALREQPGAGEIRLIAVTGYGQEEDVRRAREAGFHAHLVKPVNPETLLATLSDQTLAG